MTRYEQGFMAKCAEYGINPSTLIKMAGGNNGNPYTLTPLQLKAQGWDRDFAENYLANANAWQVRKDGGKKAEQGFWNMRSKFHNGGHTADLLGYAQSTNSIPTRDQTKDIESVSPEFKETMDEWRQEGMQARNNFKEKHPILSYFFNPY